MLLEDIIRNKSEILNIFDKYDATNVRIIGSVSRGEENDDSDIDFVADLKEVSSGALDLGAYIKLKRELEEYFNRKIDLADSKQINEQYPNSLRGGRILNR